VLNGHFWFFIVRGPEEYDLSDGAKIFVLGRTVPELAKKTVSALIFALFEHFCKMA